MWTASGDSSRPAFACHPIVIRGGPEALARVAMIRWPTRQPLVVAGETRVHEGGNEHAVGGQNAGDGRHSAVKVVDVHQRHLAGCAIEELTIPPRLGLGDVSDEIVDLVLVRTRERAGLG